MDEKSDAQLQWEEQVRLGSLQSLSHFRRLLLSGKPLSRDDRQGLIDLISYTEEHLMSMWELTRDTHELHGDR